MPQDPVLQDPVWPEPGDPRPGSGRPGAATRQSDQPAPAGSSGAQRRDRDPAGREPVDRFPEPSDPAGPFPAAHDSSGPRPAARRGRFSLRPAPGHDPTVLIVIAVIVVVALLTAVVTVIYKAVGPAHPPSARGATGTHARTITGGGKSTVAKLVLPATVKVKGGVKPNLPWPSSGQAIVAVSRLGVVGQSGGNAARPIASITKVMTAYQVLHDHPLKTGASGPTITVSPAEAAAYSQQAAGNESLVKVAAGEQLTERQALEGLLVASGDNMAQILARWDAGGVPAFVTKMNAMAKSLDMSTTHFADPDGLSSGSVSNSKDLLRLASVALSEPALTEISGMKTASIPLNTVQNYNTLLGQDGVFGIKTGSTTPAGGCLMFAAERKVGTRSYTIYGVVLGATGTRATILKNALSTSRSLIRATAPILGQVTLLKAGTPIASVQNAAGQTSTYALSHDVVVTGWKGLAWHLRLSSTLKAGQGPGQVIVKASSGKLIAPLSKVTAKSKKK